MLDYVSRYLLCEAGRHGPLALMYHSVLVDGSQSSWPWAVTLRDFRQQLDLLSAEGWHTRTVNQLSAEPRAWQEREVVITFDDGYADNEIACEELQRRGMRATWFVVAGALGQSPPWSDPGRGPSRLLAADALRNMAQAGMEIGSHGVSHVALPALDDQTLHRELQTSKAILEDASGMAVTSLAFPYGRYDERCIQAARLAGYDAACTTRSGYALVDRDLFQIRRLTVANGESAAVLARKLSFAANDGSWSRVARYAWSRVRERLAGPPR